MGKIDNEFGGMVFVIGVVYPCFLLGVATLLDIFGVIPEGNLGMRAVISMIITSPTLFVGVNLDAIYNFVAGENKQQVRDIRISEKLGVTLCWICFSIEFVIMRSSGLRQPTSIGDVAFCAVTIFATDLLIEVVYALYLTLIEDFEKVE